MPIGDSHASESFAHSRPQRRHRHQLLFAAAWTLLLGCASAASISSQCPALAASGRRHANVRSTEHGHHAHAGGPGDSAAHAHHGQRSDHGALQSDGTETTMPDAGAHDAHAEPQHGDGHGHPHDSAMPHRFVDAEQWSRRFDDPSRDAWQRPDWLIARLGLAADARVADLGAGTGYFSMRLARALPNGRVWSVDIEPTMVRYLRQRASRERLDNVFATLGTADDALLPQPVDLVLVVDTYHHIADRVAYFTRLRSSIRPNGRLVIVDFHERSPIGPPPEHRLSAQTVRDELQRAGFTFDRAVDGLAHQYVIFFRLASP